MSSGSSPSPSSSAVSLTRPIELSVKARSSEVRSILLSPSDHYHYDWSVSTDYDVQFSLKFTPRDQNQQDKASNQAPQKLNRHSGQFLAPCHGTLELKFDNSHSKLRSKSVVLREKIDNSVAPKLALGTKWMTPYGPAEVELYRESDQIYRVRLSFGCGYFPGSTIIRIGREAEQRNANERCFVGIRMFFNNDIAEAEELFKSEYETSPIFSLCYSALSFLRAILSWEKADIHEAMAKLDQTRELAQSFLSSQSAASSMVSSLKSFVSRSTAAISPKELEASIILSETSLLQSTLLFTEESYFSYVKAGLKIRSAWKGYEKCQKQLDLPEYKDAASILDRSTRGGLKFGVGTFNAMISVLPAIILRIVSALGFPSDRFLGLSSLQSAAELGGIRSPLASLSILFFNCIIPQFFSVRPEYHIQQSESVLAEAFKEYNSALFHWMNGRLQRMKRDLPAAERAFLTAAAVGPWKQLHHICWYELGFVYFFSFDYTAAIDCFRKLELENSWSPGTFIYMQAVAHLEANTDEGEAAARQCLERIDQHLKRNFGGKKLSIEAFVSHRTTEFLQNGRRPVLAALEIVYLFYGFYQMGDELLQRALDKIEERLKFQSTLTGDSRALCLLIQAGCLKGLKRRDEALKVLSELESLENSIDQEKHIIPFSRFEVAAIKMEELAQAMKNNPQKVPSNEELNAIRALLKRAESVKGDFFFKNRLHFRIHLASVELRLMAVQWNEDAKGIHDPAFSESVIDEELKALPKDEQQQQLTEEEMKQLEKEVAEEGLM